MAKIDLRLSNAVIYDIRDQFDIKQGEKFTLSISDNNGIPVRWITYNDPVLSLIEVDNANSANISAEQPGDSIIYVMDLTDKIIRKITIKVMEGIADLATDLGLKAGEPVEK